MSTGALIDGYRIEMAGAVTGSSVGGTTITSSGSANTKGSYTQLIAATAFNAAGLVLNVRTATHDDFLLDIAIGASTHEQIILSNLLMTGGQSAQSTIEGWVLPLTIPAGSRLSARVQSSGTSKTVIVQALLIGKSAGIPGASAVVSTYGANTADSGGVQVDPGGSANTKGAYSEVTAATDRDIRGIVIAVTDQHNTAATAGTWLVDIAIGAGGSEQIVIPNLLYRFGGTRIAYTPSVVFPVSLPAGTRIAARAQSTVTDATDRLFDIAIYGIGGGNGDEGSPWPILDGGRLEQEGAAISDTTAVTVTASASTNTKGSYTQIVAATEFDARGILIVLERVSTGTTNRNMLVDIAIGAGGSEQVILPNLLVDAAFSGGTSRQYFFPISVPAGSRIAARLQANVGSTTVEVQAFLFASVPGADILGSVVALGANTVDSGGVEVDAGATANTKGAYSEITAATDRDLHGIVVTVSNKVQSRVTTGNMLVDIAIGASGSEQIIIPNYMLSSDAAHMVYPTGVPFIPVSIPVGSRIAARAQCSSNNSASRTLDIVVYGVG